MSQKRCERRKPTIAQANAKDRDQENHNPFAQEGSSKEHDAETIIPRRYNHQRASNAIPTRQSQNQASSVRPPRSRVDSIHEPARNLARALSGDIEPDDSISHSPHNDECTEKEAVDYEDQYAKKEDTVLQWVEEQQSPETLAAQQEALQQQQEQRQQNQADQTVSHGPNHTFVPWGGPRARTAAPTSTTSTHQAPDSEQSAHHHQRIFNLHRDRQGRFSGPDARLLTAWTPLQAREARAAGVRAAAAIIERHANEARASPQIPFTHRRVAENPDPAHAPNPNLVHLPVGGTVQGGTAINLHGRAQNGAQRAGIAAFNAGVPVRERIREPRAGVSSILANRPRPRIRTVTVARPRRANGVRGGRVGGAAPVGVNANFYRHIVRGLPVRKAKGVKVEGHLCI